MEWTPDSTTLSCQSPPPHTHTQGRPSLLGKGEPDPTGRDKEAPPSSLRPSVLPPQWQEAVHNSLALSPSSEKEQSRGLCCAPGPVQLLAGTG